MDVCMLSESQNCENNMYVLLVNQLSLARAGGKNLLELVLFSFCLNNLNWKTDFIIQVTLFYVYTAFIPWALCLLGWLLSNRLNRAGAHWGWWGGSSEGRHQRLVVCSSYDHWWTRLGTLHLPWTSLAPRSKSWGQQ